jgi:hypothetical protein
MNLKQILLMARFFAVPARETGKKRSDQNTQ